MALHGITPAPLQWLHEKYLRSQEVLRWEGVRGFLLRAIKKIIGPLLEVQRFFFFETDLTTPLPLLRARIPLTIRPLKVEDAETFAEAFRAMGLDRQEVRRRLAQGDACILALAGTQLVYFAWITFSTVVRIDEIGVTLRLAPGECFGYNFVTFPEWRGQGIHPDASSFLLHYARSCGCTCDLFYVRADNVQNLRSLAKLPHRRTKTIWAIRLLGRRRPFLFGATREGSPSFALPSRVKRG